LKWKRVASGGQQDHILEIKPVVRLTKERGFVV
jgi:hypothetical protein